MAKRKVDDGIIYKPSKKGIWSRKADGSDEGFIHRACTPKSQHDVCEGVVVSDLVERTTAVEARGRTPNTPQTENFVTQKRRGRKPGPKSLVKVKKEEKAECECYTPHESSYKCKLADNYARLSNIHAKYAPSFTRQRLEL